jgi:hypothetical protein
MKGYESPLKTEIEGSYRKMPFRVKGSFGPLAGLMSRNSGPWPLDVTAEALDTRLVVRGEIKDVLVLRGMNLDFAMKGTDLSFLGKAFGKSLPLKGLFDTSGHMSDLAPKNYRFSDLKVAAADSELEGTVEVSLSGDRPLVKAVLRSPKLDIRPVLSKSSDSGPVGGEPKNGNVFSNSPLPLKALNYFDADLGAQSKGVEKVKKAAYPSNWEK